MPYNLFIEAYYGKEGHGTYYIVLSMGYSSNYKVFIIDANYIN